MRSAAERLVGWTPFRAAAVDGALQVDWCHLDRLPMVAPFFYETVLHAMREPFNLVFQQRTGAEALAELPPGLRVAGFIFHMSRCGSTLVSQALAAFESNIVVSEAAPLRNVLRAAASGRASEDHAVTWLQGLINAFAQARFAYKSRLVVKFMAADVLDIALVRRAFPDVPWIFLTRAPLEILASLGAGAGIDTMPGTIPAEALDLPAEAVFAMPRDAYRCQVLAAFGRAALAALDTGGGLVLDYRDLPDALWGRIPEHFGFRPDTAAVALMRVVAQRDAKRPERRFHRARDAQRSAAAPGRETAALITGDVMAALDAARRAAA